METDFELNKSQWFETQTIAEIEEWEPDQYGNIWYGVKFVGDADTMLWLAKNKPDEGKKYYGHLEKTKSGKRLRFRTDKVPDDEPKPAQKGAMQSTDEAIARAVALKAAVEYGTANKFDDTATLDLADMFLSWLKGEEIEEPPKSEKKDEIIEPGDEPVDLDDVPPEFR